MQFLSILEIIWQKWLRINFHGGRLGLRLFHLLERTFFVQNLSCNAEQALTRYTGGRIDQVHEGNFGDKGKLPLSNIVPPCQWVCRHSILTWQVEKLLYLKLNRLLICRYLMMLLSHVCVKCWPKACFLKNESWLIKKYSKQTNFQVKELVFSPISMVGISNGWNRFSIVWIFLPIFAKPNGWKNPMVEPVSNGWIRLLKCILSNGWNDSDWLKLFVRYLCISKIWTLIEVYEKRVTDNYEFFLPNSKFIVIW